MITLTGRVDLSTIPTLQGTLVRTIGDHPGSVVAVDLDGLDTLDDVGMGVIIGAAGRARRSGGDVVVVTADDALRQRLALTGFDRAITVSASLPAPP